MKWWAEPKLEVKGLQLELSWKPLKINSADVLIMSTPRFIPELVQPQYPGVDNCIKGNRCLHNNSDDLNHVCCNI